MSSFLLHYIVEKLCFKASNTFCHAGPYFKQILKEKYRYGNGTVLPFDIEKENARECSDSLCSFSQGTQSANPHNDYCQHFVDTGQRPHNFIRDVGKLVSVFT